MMVRNITAVIGIRSFIKHYQPVRFRAQNFALVPVEVAAAVAGAWLVLEHRI